MRAIRLRRRREPAVTPAAVPDDHGVPAPPAQAEDTERELASRRVDGLHVVLLWRPRDDAVAVSVDDSRTGRQLKFPVDVSRALEAFYHPFAFAP